MTESATCSVGAGLGPHGCGGSPFYNFLVANRVDDAGGKVLQSIHGASERLADTVTTGIRSNSDAIHSTGEKVLLSVCETSKDNMMTTNDNGRFITSTVHDATNTVRDSADRNAIDVKNVLVNGFNEQERAHGITRLSNERSQGELRALVDRNHAGALLASKDILLENQKAHCETDRLILANTLEISKSKSDIERQASDNAAAIQLAAHEHRAALATQMAECCCTVKQLITAQSCEVKELVREQANSTQLLVRQIESDRVRDQLTAANTENLILRLGGASGLAGVAARR
jgi:hypothetical protein